MKLKIPIYLVSIVLLISCTTSPKSDLSFRSVSTLDKIIKVYPTNYNTDDSFLEKWLEYSFLGSSAEKHEDIWKVITARKYTLEERLTYLKEAVPETKEYDVLTVITQAQLWGEMNFSSDKNETFYLQEYQWEKEISENIDLFYDSKVTYHFLWDTPLKYRHVFLENGELRVYTWLGLADMKLKTWESKNDTIYYYDSDTTHIFIEKNDGLCPASNKGRWLWFI